MSEQQPEQPAPSEPTEPQPTPEQPKPTETVEFWKRQARENEARAKSNAEAAKRWAEAEEAQKSEQQRQTEAQARLERERDEARAEGVRYKVAAMHGITEDNFDLLGSGDEEAITARAERIKAMQASSSEVNDLKARLEALEQGKQTPAAGRPTQALKPGATPENETDADAEYAAMAAVMNLPT